MATNTDRSRATEPRMPSSISQSHHRPASRPVPRQANVSGSTTVGVIVVLVLIGVVVVGVGWGSSLFTASDGNKYDAMTHTVSRGELLITVIEDGEVESAVNEDIKCKVKGGTSILKIVEDGTRIIAKADKISDDQVAVGDVIVELDRSSIEEQLDTQKITYEKAIASRTQAEKDAEVAEISVEEYVKGTYIKEHQDVEANIRIAQENLSSAKSLLAHTEKMYRRNFATAEQLKADKFAVERSELELGSATTAKMVLEKYTRNKMLKDLKSQVETAKARLRAENAALSLEKGRLKRLEEQFQYCVIRAPREGMVVYANITSRRGGQEVVIEEGAMIREQQTIIRLPDFSQMQVRVKVHESKIEKIKVGMPANIKILDRELKGIVISKANQAEPGSWFSAAVKEYAAIVEISGDPTGLRPGMSAEVEIFVARLENVLTVPVQAVVEKRRKFYCWVKTANGPQRRPVIIGLSDDKVIEIKDGVIEGEEVILNPRALVPDARDGDDQADEGPPKKKFDLSDVKKTPGSSKNSSAAHGTDKDEADKGGAAKTENTESPGRSSGRRQFDLMQFDKDGDGKVSKEEAPERMRSFFDRMDANGDGFIDKAEIAEMRKRRAAGGGRGGRPGGPGGNSGARP